MHRLPVAVMLVLVFLPGAAGVLAASAETGEPAAQLQQLRERMGALREELNSIRGQRDSMHNRLEAAEKEVGVIAAELHRLDVDLGRTGGELQSLGEERRTQRQRLAGMRAALGRDLRTAYTMGKQEQVKLLLNQEEPAAIGRMLAYHGYFARARAERMQAVRVTLDNLADIERSIIEQQQHLEALRQQKQQQSGQLASSQLDRQRILARLQVELGEKASELSVLERNERRLEQLVQSLQQALRDVPPAAGQFRPLQALKGKLSWPVAGRLVQHYGARQAAGKLSARGLQIAAPAGTEVRAISKGRIAFADWLRGFGLLLIIEHGEGYMSLYGHNRSLYKEVGEWVEQGEVIAAVGNSGGHPQPGLYLELRKDGRPFNPGPWFAGKPALLQASH